MRNREQTSSNTSQSNEWIFACFFSYCTKMSCRDWEFLKGDPSSDTHMWLNFEEDNDHYLSYHCHKLEKPSKNKKT